MTLIEEAPAGEGGGLASLPCPTCQRLMFRVRRKLHQRVLIGSKRFYCANCHQMFLQWITLVKDRTN